MDLTRPEPAFSHTDVPFASGDSVALCVPWW